MGTEGPGAGDRARARRDARRWSLRTQLLWALALAAALPVLLFGLVEAEAWFGTESTRADRETRLASDALSRELGREIDVHADIVLAMASEFGERGHFSEPELSRTLGRYRARFPSFYMTLAIRPDGRTIATDPPLGSDAKPAAGTSYGDRPYFGKILAGATIAVSDVLTSRRTGQPALIMAAPIHDRDGRLIGVASAGVELAVFRQAVERVTSTVPDSHGVVLDGSGRVVASAGKIVYAAQRALGEQPLYRPIHGDEEQRVARDEAGVEHRGAFSRVESAVVSWSVGVALPESSVRVRVIQAFRNMAVFALGALALGLAIAVLVSRWIARPVGDAAALVEAIGRGDLSAKPAPEHGFQSLELLHLRASLAETIDRLQSLITELGTTVVAVDEVTRELGGASAQMVNDARAQEQAVRTSSGAIVQMTDSIADVTLGVRELTASAGETTHSILSFDRQIEVIAGNLEKLTNAIDRASASLEQVTHQVDAVFQSADQLDRSVDHTTASLATLTESIATVTDGAEQSQALANDVIRAADAGSAAVSESMSATRAIGNDFQAVRAAVQRLADRSEAIEQVTAVISDVARATHVLAINASIIASQAGEHGKRFTVVAERVRLVASETAASTQQITALVSSVQSDIRQAVQAVERGQSTVQVGEQRSDEVERRLRLIIESSTGAELQVRRIASAARQQSHYVGDVEAALAEVRDATLRINSASAEQRGAHRELEGTMAQLSVVGSEVRHSTEMQRKDSRAMTTAVRTMTERLGSIAADIQAQHDEREHIAQSLQIFNLASLAGVERALKIERSVTALSNRLAVLERQMRSFRLH